MKWCFEGSVLQDPFSTCFSSDHNKVSMANANIDTLYAGSLRIKKHISFQSSYHFISGA